VVANLTNVLLAGFGIDWLRCERAMKTAATETQTAELLCPATEHMVRQVKNRSRSIKRAAKEEQFQPREKFFFLTFPFIEQIRHYFLVARDTGENFAKVRWQPNGADGLCFMREARSS
jgi:hypothetical protein